VAVSKKDRSDASYVVTGCCVSEVVVGAGAETVATEKWSAGVADAETLLVTAASEVGVDSAVDGVLSIPPVNEGMPNTPVLSESTLVGMAETPFVPEALRELASDNGALEIEALASPTEPERTAEEMALGAVELGTTEAANDVGTALGTTTELTTVDEAETMLGGVVRPADALDVGTKTDEIDADPVAPAGGTVTVTYIVVSMVTTRTEPFEGSASTVVVPVGAGRMVVGAEAAENPMAVLREAGEVTADPEADTSAPLDDAGTSAKTAGTTYL